MQCFIWKNKTLHRKTSSNKLFGPIQPNQAHFWSVEHLSWFKKEVIETHDVAHVAHHDTYLCKTLDAMSLPFHM